MVWLIALSLGVVIGLLSAFLGLGGGVVMVPVLPSLFGLSLREAVATSLAVVAAVTLMNCLRFFRKGELDVSVGALVGVFAAVGGLVTGGVSHHIPDQVVVWTLSAVLLSLSVYTLKPLLFAAKSQTLSGGSLGGARQKVLSVFLGLFAGVLNGVTGLGGGIIVSPIFLATAVVPKEKVVPTANLVMFLGSFFAVSSMIFSGPQFSWPQWGPVRLDIAITLFATAFLASQLGVSKQAALPDKVRRVLLSVLLLGLFVKMLVGQL